MSLSTRIADYTNSVANENVAKALEKGVDYTLSIVAMSNPGLLGAFSQEQDTSIAGGGVQTAGIDWIVDYSGLHLIDVRIGSGSPRVNFCQPVPATQAKHVEDSKSIYYALTDNPVYWLDNQNKLFIRPAPTGWAITYVKSASGRTINDNSESVTNFPSQFLELVVLHAAELILIERLADFRTKLPTDLDADTTLFDQIADLDLSITYTFPSNDFQDAIDKAKNLIDGQTLGGDTEAESVQYWLADEDEDMVASTLSVAGQELARANAYLSEFNAEINAQVTSKSQELQEFQTNLQKKMTLFDKIIQKIQVDYQWTQGQLQLVSGKKQEFIQANIGSAGILDNPEESKAV